MTERRSDGTFAPKRYVGSQVKITLEVHDFEAMWLANRLWERAERLEERGLEQMAIECKWWSRKLQSERKTRAEQRDC